MLSFPCFSKYFESYLDVRTYSIVFPRKIVVPWVISFPRVIAFPSILVKKKIGTIYSFLLHPFTLAHSTPGSVCQKKKKKTHSCHCRLRHLEGDAKVESDPDWLIYEDFESSQRNRIEREQSSNVHFQFIWCHFLMRVTFSWGTTSYKKNLKYSPSLEQTTTLILERKRENINCLRLFQCEEIRYVMYNPIVLCNKYFSCCVRYVLYKMKNIIPYI